MTERQKLSSLFCLSWMFIILVSCLYFGALGWIDTLYYTHCFLSFSLCSRFPFEDILAKILFISVHFMVICTFFICRNIQRQAKKNLKTVTPYQMFQGVSFSWTPCSWYAFPLVFLKFLVRPFLALLAKIPIINIAMLCVYVPVEERETVTIKTRVKRIVYGLLFLTGIKLNTFSAFVFASFRLRALVYAMWLIPFLLFSTGYLMTYSLHQGVSLPSGQMFFFLPAVLAKTGVISGVAWIVGYFGGYGHSLWQDGHKRRAGGMMIIALTSAIVTYVLVHY